MFIQEAENYLNVCQTIIDRIDLHVQVPTLRYSELENNRSEESSVEIKEGECQEKNTAGKI